MAYKDYLGDALKYAQFIAEGHSIIETAREYRVSQETVSKNFKRLWFYPEYRGLMTRAELVLYRIQHHKPIPQTKGRL